MKILFLLISISILVAGGFLALFIWAVRSGQFDDTKTPSFRMLFESKSEKEQEKKINNDEENHTRG